MEPFGLFQFLQSLLAKPDENEVFEPTSPPQKEPNSAPSTATENPSQPPSQQNAFLDFLTAHEQRVKNTRK